MSSVSRIINIVKLNSVIKLSNNVEMPTVGFGTYLVKDVKPIEYCFRNNVFNIDTASLYDNESLIGEYCRKEKIPREKLFITSKLKYTHHGYENCLKGFEESNKALGLEYIVHWPDTSFPDNKNARRETWRAMEEIYSSGKVRAIGVSNYTIKHLREMESYAKIIPTVNQIECHVLNQQKELREYCREKDIAVVSFRSLGSGKLLNHETIVEMGKKYQKTSAQILLRFCLQNEMGIIPKTSKEKRLKENIDIFDFEISEGDMKELYKLDEKKYLSTFSYYGKIPEEIE